MKTERYFVLYSLSFFLFLKAITKGCGCASSEALASHVYPKFSPRTEKKKIQVQIFVCMLCSLNFLQLELYRPVEKFIHVLKKFKGHKTKIYSFKIWYLRNHCLLQLVLSQLTQLESFGKRNSQLRNIPPSDWLMGKRVVHFINDWCERVQPIVDGWSWVQ